MNKHTPGPWVWRKDYCGLENPEIKEFVLAYESYEGMSLDDYPGTGREEANANLIAAAPELLEALEGMLEMYTQLVNCGDCGIWDAEKENEVIASRFAIAKARGEKQ